MNPVVHFEIPYEDEERAKEFYEEVFDWNLNSMPEMNYTIAHTVEVDENQMPKSSGKINGGMFKREKDSAQTPVLVIDVPNIDEYIVRVAEAGGEVFREKTQVGDMGWYAQIKDTEGNIVGIWETIPK